MKGTEISLFEVNGLNVLGLREGQAFLYKYIEACNKENTPILAKELIEIYYNKVRDPEGWFLGQNRYWMNINNPSDPVGNLKNKDAYNFFTTSLTHKHYYGSWLMHPVKNWLKASIGSLVMRGFLNIVPKLDTELLEK